MIIIGFTGPQNGMTPVQRARVFSWLMTNAGRIQEAHHGDCVGSDAAFHTMCLTCNIPRIVIHPPVDDRRRAHCDTQQEVPKGIEVEVLEPKPFLERDKDIAEAVRLLLATPEQPFEQVRSGTWTTIRYARKAGVQVVAYHPVDGSLLKLYLTMKP